jgi:hypothetical protein
MRNISFLNGVFCDLCFFSTDFFEDGKCIIQVLPVSTSDIVDFSRLSFFNTGNIGAYDVIDICEVAISGR